MGAKLRLQNDTPKSLLLQIELAGLTTTLEPSREVLIDTDFAKGEEIHIEIRADRIVVWGGVAATVLK